MPDSFWELPEETSLWNTCLLTVDSSNTTGVVTWRVYEHSSEAPGDPKNAGKELTGKQGESKRTEYQPVSPRGPGC